MVQSRKPLFPPAFGGFRITALLPSAVPQIARIERLSFPEPFPPSRLWLNLLRPGVFYLTAWSGRRVAAYFGFEVCGQLARVLSNATHPDFRRRGLGRFLLEAATLPAKARGARYFLGEVRSSNRAQLALLSSLGWEVLARSPAFFQNGEDALIVWRDLGS